MAELVDVKIGKRKFRVIDMSGVSNLTFNLPYTGSNPVLTTNPQPTLVGANSGEGGVHI